MPAERVVDSTAHRLVMACSAHTRRGARAASAAARVAVAGSLAIPLALASAPAPAPDPASTVASARLLRSVAVSLPAPSIPGLPAPTHRMRIEAALVAGSGWSVDDVLLAIRRAAGILAQCAIRIATVRLGEFDVPPRYRYLQTSASRDFARELQLRPPALFFVAGTLQQPAFDAEAVGRANSATRPEMAGTVWIAAGARDLPIAIAHELAHVLADSGSHSNEPGNLMREDTAPANRALSASQCAQMVARGEAHGLLQPLK